ncbi:MAG: ABC transporter permease [Pyrinomonadaceae bacterium]|nr:ABC transporter permease [Pyrinomonadaceae bacterium]
MSINQPSAAGNSPRPDEITKIEPAKWRNVFAWREFWSYRELLYFLTWRDVKVRYRQTAIGVLWAILQPVLTTAIFTIIFSRFARFESLQISYPLFALSGLLIWLYVNNSVTLASNSLVGNTNLVTKIYFPRLIVPTAATFSGLIDLALSFVILVGLMIYYGVNLTFQILLAPLFVVLAILLAISFGTLFSALNVRFRDVKFALPFFLQIWMFLSPIFYPSDILPEKWRVAFALNPLTGILQGFRASMFGGSFDWFSIGAAVVLTFALAGVSFFVFKRMEDDFADLI